MVSRMRRLLVNDPERFVQVIKLKAGRRLGMLHGGDLEQVFWLGVLEAIPHLNRTGKGDEVHYLLQAGFGSVRDYRRSEWSSSLVHWCPVCKRWFGYRGKHEHPLRTMTRAMPLSETLGQEEQSIVELSIEEFVHTLEGREAYVARRLLIDRLDMMSGTPMEDLARELGVGRTRASQIKTSVAVKLRAWMA